MLSPRVLRVVYFLVTVSCGRVCVCVCVCVCLPALRHSSTVQHCLASLLPSARHTSSTHSPLPVLDWWENNGEEKGARLLPLFRFQTKNRFASGVWSSLNWYGWNLFTLSFIIIIYGVRYPSNFSWRGPSCVCVCVCVCACVCVCVCVCVCPRQEQGVC